MKRPYLFLVPCSLFLAAFASANAYAVTATKAYVDSRDAATLSAATNAANAELSAATNALAEAIAKAEPGDYAAVSNAAMTALQPAATNGLVTASVTNGLASAAALSAHASAATNYTDAAVASAVAYTTGVSNKVEAAQSAADTNAAAIAAETKAREDAGYLTAESDPEWRAWMNDSSIALGLGAAASGDSSVALGFGAYATNGTMGIAYAPDQINLCSINSLPNPGSTARSLQSYLDERATTSDLAAVKANASSALSTANANKSSISAINSAGYVTKTTADAAYYPKASGDAWSSYWDGDDVRVTVTNYDSVAHLPTLYLEQRTNDTASASDDEAFRVVWKEMTHWDAFLGSTWNWEDAT